MNTEDMEDLPSRPFTGFDWSEHFNVQKLIVDLFGEFEAWYMGSDDNKRVTLPIVRRRHLTHIVLEAYRTHRAMPGLLLGIHRGNYYYNQAGDRYHPNHLSFRIFNKVMDFLIDAEFMEMISEGIWHPDPNKRRTGRYRATDRLINLCHEHDVNPYMITRYRTYEIIVLRAKRKGKQRQGDLINYKNTQFTKRARADLEKINEFIAGHNINLDITDDQEEALRDRMQNRDDPARDNYLDFTKTHLRRIFNNGSFEQGGRFYGGWWQEIFSEYRHFITIDGKRTVGLDYSGMHFAIMYADLGMNAPMELSLIHISEPTRPKR